MKHVALFVVSATVALPTATFGAPPPGPPNPTIVAPALHELTRLDTPVCGRLVVHANSAIAGILHDDAAIRLAVARLRSVDLDGANPLARRAVVLDLEHLAADLTDRSRSADGEIKRLRETLNPAATAGDDATASVGAASPATNADGTPAQSAPSAAPASPSPAGPTGQAHPADLRAFVEALSDALGRQRRVAVDLTTFMANLENRELRDDNLPPDDATGRRPSNAPLGAFGSAGAQSAAVFASARQSPREMALATAGDFEARAADIKRDEARAAEFSEGAVAGCN